MSDEKEPGEPIRAPLSDPKREITRAVIEGAAGLVPGGGALARLYQTTHPSKAKIDQADWQEKISERTNEHSNRLDQHEQILAPKETIAGPTAQLVAELVKECPDGLCQKRYQLDDFCALLPNETRQVVEDATFELQAFGLLDVQHFIGSDWRAQLTFHSYEQLDHQLMGWNTIHDAAAVAGMMLESGSGSAPDLHSKTGWSKRRFNPAFRYLLQFFPEGRIRRVLQPDYPSLGVLVMQEDKVRLRRFVATVDADRS